jgi:hypothetical protein
MYPVQNLAMPKNLRLLFGFMPKFGLLKKNLAGQTISLTEAEQEFGGPSCLGSQCPYRGDLSQGERCLTLH